MAVFSPSGLLPAIDPFPQAPRVWVAFSGGLDSSVLLQALAALRAIRRLDLAAIHVDHGLSPHASAWAGHCHQVCAGLEVPLTVRRLDLRRRPGESLEALAREARYAILRQAAGPGDLVLTDCTGATNGCTPTLMRQTLLNGTVDFAVPAPAPLALIGVGLLGLGWARRRRS
jgi:tRNA(Ile)-lysidine synthase